MVLGMVLRFRARNGGGRIYEIAGFAFGNRARKRARNKHLPNFAFFELF
jgi:hypothetical protein